MHGPVLQPRSVNWFDKANETEVLVVQRKFGGSSRLGKGRLHRHSARRSPLLPSSNVSPGPHGRAPALNLSRPYALSSRSTMKTYALESVLTLYTNVLSARRLRPRRTTYELVHGWR
jgi:hypothetical protein